MTSTPKTVLVQYELGEQKFRAITAKVLLSAVHQARGAGLLVDAGGVGLTEEYGDLDDGATYRFVAAADGASTSSDPVSAKLLPLLDQLLRGQDKTHGALSMLAALQAQEFTYAESKASGSRSPDDFKERLFAFYGIPCTDQMIVQCMLSRGFFSKRIVTAAHVFKHCWAKFCKVILRLEDINDPGNGLLLFKPLERAFDDSRICFEYKDGEFYMVLLDDSMRNMTLTEYAESKSLFKHDKTNDLDPAASTTFGQLEGRQLHFGSNNRPLKRCLGFHAQRALCRASSEGWLPQGFQVSPTLKYTSEDVDTAARTREWLDAAASYEDYAEA